MLDNKLVFPTRKQNCSDSDLNTDKTLHYLWLSLWVLIICGRLLITGAFPDDVQQLLQYSSTSVKVSPCVSGLVDSLMAPLFAPVRWVYLNLPRSHYAPPSPSPPHLHSDSGNSLGVAQGKKRCRIWSYHHTTRNRQREAFIWPLPPVLGSLWQESGWWEGWSSECSGWM